MPETPPAEPESFKPPAHPDAQSPSVLPFVAEQIKRANTTDAGIVALIQKLNSLVPNGTFAEFLISLEEDRKKSQGVSFLVRNNGQSAMFTSPDLIKNTAELIDYFEKGLLGSESELFTDAFFKPAIQEWAVEWKKTHYEGEIRIKLPCLGRLTSEFAEEVADVIKDTNTLFFRNDSREVVEIGKIKHHESSGDKFTGFIPVKPNRFVTLAEKHIVPCNAVYDKLSDSFVLREKSMSGELANTVLQSEVFQSKLPPIDRIFTIPIPIISKNELTFPSGGYDVRFYSWLPHNAPQITKPDMHLKESKDTIYQIFKEFCFQTKQDYINAVAGLLTPFLRGLFPSFSTRTPIFFYIANRERAGKDYLAGITGIVYEGVALEEPPISTTENSKSNNTEELRKKILSALIMGRKRLHFSNNKGHINNGTLEMITTAETYSDRVLGRSETLNFDNELDFSLSGNIGVTYTPDFANRCRLVNLFLDIEDANARKFENPNLHHWVRDNRELILSAMYALVRNWFENGKKKGTLPFASFPDWAEICGGIMESAGYDSPCATDKASLSIAGDSETQDMKALFELCYEKRPEEPWKKSEIKDVIRSDDCNLFGYLDFGKQADAIKFGNKLTKFVGRVLSDIRLIVKDATIRGARQELIFTKEKHEIDRQAIFGDGKSGSVGSLGSLSKPRSEQELNGDTIVETLPALPRLPKATTDPIQKLTPDFACSKLIEAQQAQHTDIINEADFRNDLQKWGTADEVDAVLKRAENEGQIFRPRPDALRAV